MDIEIAITEQTEREAEISAPKCRIAALEEVNDTLRDQLALHAHTLRSERQRLDSERQMRFEAEDECLRLRKRMFAWSVRALPAPTQAVVHLNDASRAAALHYSRFELALAQWVAFVLGLPVHASRLIPRLYLRTRVWYRYVLGVAFFRCTGCRLFKPEELPPDQYRAYRAAGGI